MKWMQSSHRVVHMKRESVCVTTHLGKSQETTLFPYLSCLVEPCIANNLIFTAIESGHLKLYYRDDAAQFDPMTAKISFVSSHVLLRHEAGTWNLPLSLEHGCKAKVSYHVTLGSCPLTTLATREAWTCFLSQSKNSDHFVPTWNYFNTLPPHTPFFWDESKASNLGNVLAKWSLFFLLVGLQLIM